CEYTGSCVFEALKLCLALDLNAQLGETIDQQGLMLVLGKNQRIRERAATRAHVAEDGTCSPLARHPKICREHLPSTLDDWIDEVHLTVQFERACLNGKSARRCPGSVRLVDDPDSYAEPGQPEGQDQARRPCADNKNVCPVSRRFTHCVIFSLPAMIQALKEIA